MISYLTVKEVAERLKCSPKTIRRLIKYEGLPVVSLSSSKTNKHELVIEQSLENWMRSRESAGCGVSISYKANARPLRRRSTLTKAQNTNSLKPFENSLAVAKNLSNFSKAKISN